MAFREEIAHLPVDEHMTLSFILTESSPMVTIHNNDTGKRRSVALSWFLQEGREMHVRTGPRATRTYTVQELDETLSSLVTLAMAHPLVKPLIWQTFRTLTEVLHQPKVITRESEYGMLSEEKRTALWLSWMLAGASVGRLIPCFPAQGQELELLEKHTAGGPWKEGVRVTAQENGVAALQKKGILTSLMRATPQRWYLPLMVASSSAVLGMVEAGNDEDGNFLAHQLWKQRAEVRKPGGTMDRAVIAPAAADLTRRLVAFIRHFYELPLIDCELTVDGHEQLLKENYGRRDRIDLPAGQLGKAEYVITSYTQKDSALGALVYHPKGRTVLKDCVLRYPHQVYPQALDNDSCGSIPDNNVTVLNLLRAVRFQAWMERILRITRNTIPSGF